MNRLCSRFVALVVVAMAGLQACAFAALPTVAEDAASRTRIRSERQQANAQYAAREAACKQRFVVASCLTDAAVARRSTLERLQEEEAVINERLRAGRADAAARRVADKKEAQRKAAIDKEAAVRAAADKPGATAGPTTAPTSQVPAASSSGAVMSQPDEAARAAKPRKPPTPSRTQPTTSNVPSAEKREQARAAYDRRHQDAEKHRLEVQARNAKNAAKKKPGEPLPMPEAP